MKLFRLDLPPERAHQLVAELDKLTAADLTHPVLAAPIAAGLAGVCAYLAQDFVAAESLDTVVREHGPAPAADAIRVAAQLAGALDFAAAADIVHGALHPRDVLVSSDDTRLTGVGIARALERAGIAAPVRHPYTAPERSTGTGAAWDRRADGFSLAAVIYEMVWGRRVAGLGEQAAEAITEVNGGDLAALRRLFARALAEDPRRRFDTALAFAEALKDAFVLEDAAPAPAPARRNRRAPVVEEPPPLVEAPSPIEEPRLPLDEPELPLNDPPTDFDIARVFITNDPPASVESENLDLHAAETPPPSPPQQPVETRRQDDHVRRTPRAGAAGARSAPDVSRTLFGETETAYARSASETTRRSSGNFPLGLALIVGLAIGFAAGYALGGRAQLPGQTQTATTSAPPAAPIPAAATPAAREFTENAVKDAPPAATTLVAATPAGRILVRSTPAGAHVFIDGRDVGRTPVTARNVARGAHTVRIVREGYASMERRVVVTAGQPAPALTVALATSTAPARSGAAPSRPTPATPAAGSSGSLTIDSRPSGARVFLDGRLVGTTPLALDAVGAGEHGVYLEHDGYRRWTASVRVVGGERQRVTGSLER